MEIMNNSGWERDFDDAEIEFIVSSYNRGMSLDECIGGLDYAQRYVEDEIRLDRLRVRIDQQLKRAA